MKATWFAVYGPKFKVKAAAIHEQKYSYDDFIYLGNKVLGAIHCNTCDTAFNQSPNNHLKGAGCPKCGFARSNIAKRTSKNGPAILYYVYFKHINKWKIGVTERLDVVSRFTKEEQKHLEILMVKSYGNAGEAYRDEARMLEVFSEQNYNYLKEGKLLKSKGNSELLNSNIINELVKCL
jgi:hypothetical protein